MIPVASACRSAALLRTQGPRRVPVRPRTAREVVLPCELLERRLAVLRAGQRGEEGNQIVDLGFLERERLHVLVEEWIVQVATLVVMIEDIPQGDMRAIMEIRGG